MILASDLTASLPPNLQSWAYAIGCWSVFVAAFASSRKLRRRLAADGPEALIWAALLSLFLGFAGELLNARLPLWTHLGLPFEEPWRTAAQGLSFAAALPTLLAFAFLLGPAESVASGPVPRTVFLAAAGLAATSTLVSRDSLDAASALSLAAVFLAFDCWNARAARPSLLGALRFGPPRPALAPALGAVVWAAADRLSTAVAPPGRIYIGFSDPSPLGPILALQAVAAWACYVAAASWLGRPMLLLGGTGQGDKEQLKIFE